MPVRNQEGAYYGTIKECGLDENKNGKPYIYIVCDVTHFASGGEWQELPKPMERTMQGLYVNDAVFNNPQSHEILQRKLLHLQFNGDFANIQLTQEGVEIVCWHERDNHGNERERWDIKYPYERRERKHVGGNRVASLNSKWKQICKEEAKPAAPATTPPKVAPAPAQQGLSIPEDDIPFDDRGQ